MKKILLSILIIFTLIFTGCNASSVSITDAEINGDGELIIKYSNGSQQNLGVVVGRDGIDGQDGADGIDGQDGKDGKDGVDGQNGKDGQDGINGVDGQDGKDGVDGQNGINGKNGKDGIDGINGKDGKDGINSDGVSLTSAVSVAMKSAVSVWCALTNPVTNDVEAYSSGSGIIYQLDKQSGDAFIITNYHVIFNADSEYKTGICENIFIFLYGDESDEGAIPATFIGGAINNDIAILKVTDSELLRNSNATAVETADSDNTKVGETAIAIGNPESMGISVTTGIVSVDSEYIELAAADASKTISVRVLRTDTPVNQGNSGGGLFNEHGKLIGIVTAKSARSDVDDFGYAIPSNTVIALAENIVDNCYQKSCITSKKALVGITVSSTNFRAVYDEQTGLPSLVEDTIITDVNESGLANGKLQKDDIILSVRIGSHYVELTRQYQLLDIMLYAREGDTVTVTVLRGDQTLTYDFSIAERNLEAY